MKRILALLLLLSTLICAFAACNAKDDAPETDAPTEAPTAAPTEKKALTVNQVLKFFDNDVYSKQTYTKDQIATIKEKLTLEGDILKVVHLVDKNTTSENLIWAYVYEFSLEDDAKVYEEDRSAFVAAKYGDEGYCVRFGKIVVFGNSSVIPTIEE